MLNKDCLCSFHMDALPVFCSHCSNMVNMFRNLMLHLSPSANINPVYALCSRLLSLSFILPVKNICFCMANVSVYPPSFHNIPTRTLCYSLTWLFLCKQECMLWFVTWLLSLLYFLMTRHTVSSDFVLEFFSHMHS